jgi:methylmalonyl-CoA mutase
VPAEIRELIAYGVTRIYSPQDGATLGLQGMIDDVIRSSDYDLAALAPAESDAPEALKSGDRRKLARIITAVENRAYSSRSRQAILQAAAPLKLPVLGITGTGGAGKSSLTDELILRLRLDQEDRLRIAVISIDPSRKRTGGALLGDRIRMNAIDSDKIFMRSLATRDTGNELSAALPEVLACCKLSGFDLIVVETSGIGQGESGIVPLVGTSLYVMTPEFGAASQLEKIDMLDFADFVAINKFDRKGAEDALRDVRKQYQRNRGHFQQAPDTMPVFGTMASRFNDDGVTALYQAMLPRLQEQGLKVKPGKLPRTAVKASSRGRAVVPPERVRYLAEISGAVRDYHRHIDAQARAARERQSLETARTLFERAGKPVAEFGELISAKAAELSPASVKLLEQWPKTRELYAADEYVVRIRDKELRTTLTYESLSGTKVRKVSLPRFEDDGEILRFLMKENVPGSFPYTAGVFAFKREGEDPTRMFAGEGDAFRTNQRFKRVSEGMPAHRLSTAFDSVTLYGSDPDPRPDIYGKVGNSGVSIATLEDMKVLYSGFDLCAPSTSVSMTINGPAPILLAMFMNTAIDQQVDKFRDQNGREATEDELQKIKAWTLSTVRGTVQADILKEDQGQNTCIFSTEFALKMMGDIQEYFVHNHVQNFYSVSISGYHIAEAGANPISQLAFTLANGFTYVESYLARGMHIDDFASNLSFFFSNGMDPEYSVIGRVARRIWAVAMKNKYGASERSQKLKYHVQTSGRSLHAQEMAFNDIRTSLQALCAIYDNCNSLHTNAYDEAVTTPTEESVRRAMAIQLIINREWGLAKNENPNQGSFIIDELTDLVEEAVLKEFDAIASRGGVLGAMETGYQRGKIQDESMFYEHKKHDGSLPIIGVNTFRNPAAEAAPQSIELARSSEAEKQSQLERLRKFQACNAASAPPVLERLRSAVIANGNTFEVLMEAVRACSLGQITGTLYEVGGKYRRNM